MGRIKETESIVCMIDLGNTIQCMQVQKGSSTVYVLQSHEYIAVVDKYVKAACNEPFVRLAKVFNNPKQAYEEWLHVIGKMCKKDKKSKYFLYPKPEEHLTNGGLPAWARPVILDMANTTLSIVSTF